MQRHHTLSNRMEFALISVFFVEVLDCYNILHEYNEILRLYGIITPSEIQQRKQSFFPRTIFDWNMLLQPIVLSGSVETFKSVVSSIKYVFNLFQFSCVYKTFT